MPINVSLHVAFQVALSDLHGCAGATAKSWNSTQRLSRPPNKRAGLFPMICPKFISLRISSSKYRTTQGTCRCCATYIPRCPAPSWSDLPRISLRPMLRATIRSRMSRTALIRRPHGTTARQLPKTSRSRATPNWTSRLSKGMSTDYRIRWQQNLEAALLDFENRTTRAKGGFYSFQRSPTSSTKTGASVWARTHVGASAVDKHVAVKSSISVPFHRFQLGDGSRLIIRERAAGVPRIDYRLCSCTFQERSFGSLKYSDS
jgi:hypothetical protein